MDHAIHGRPVGACDPRHLSAARGPSLIQVRRQHAVETLGELRPLADLMKREAWQGPERVPGHRVSSAVQQ